MMPRRAGAVVALVLAGCAASAPPSTSTAPQPAVRATPSAPAPIALRNAGFEEPPRVGERCAPGWSCTAHAHPEAFRFDLGSDAAEGARALCVERVHPEPWAIVSQNLDALPAWHGRTLRFSVSVRSAGVDGPGAGPWALVHGVHGQLLKHEQKLVARTAGWERHAIEVPVAAGAARLEVGVVIEGGGRVCLDGAHLEPS